MNDTEIDAVIVRYGVSDVLPHAVRALVDDQSVRCVILVDNGGTAEQLVELERRS